MLAHASPILADGRWDRRAMHRAMQPEATIGIAAGPLANRFGS